MTRIGRSAARRHCPPARIGALLLLASLAAGGVARAQDKSDVQAAAEAYDAGVQAHRQRDYARAASLFTRADELAPDPAARLAALKSALLADDPVLGMNLAERTLRVGPVEGALAEAVGAAQAKFRARVGSVRIACSGCTATLDGNPIAPGQDVLVVRGPHAIELVAAGRVERRSIDVSGPGPVEVSPEPAAPAREPAAPVPAESAAPAPPRAPPPPEPAADRPPSGISPAWFFAGAGVTVLAGTLTIASGVDVRNREQDFYREPTARKATDGQAAETRTYVLGAVTGAAALATAAVGVFAVRWRGPTASARASVGAGLASVSGVF